MQSKLCLVAASVSALVLGACNDKVLDPQPQSIARDVTNGSIQVDSIVPTISSLNVGDTAVLTPLLTDGTGRTWNGQHTTWSVSDTSVASIYTAGTGTWEGSVGVLRGIKGGTVTVTVTTQFGTTKSMNVQVLETAQSVSGTAIYPGQSIQDKVNSMPGGTTFILKAGTHRMQTVYPKSGDKFTGESGARMSGAKVVTGWYKSGGLWVAANQTQRAQVTNGTCMTGYSMCNYSEDLFINSSMLHRVSSSSQVGSGKWYFDRSASKVYIADDPTNKTVEMSITKQAFAGSASSVNISNLTIEKYASPAQFGAIAGDNAYAWTISNNEIRYNHGVGVKAGDHWQLYSNNIHHNGQMGITGYRVYNVVMQGNELAYNNADGFSPFWEAGATKFVSSHYLIYRSNYVHNNKGKGLWTDIDNIYCTYDGNTITDNDHQGISHEVGYDCVIKNNTVLRNGFQNAGGYAGAGIGIVSSPNVEIYNNTVSGNAHGIVARMYSRGSGAYGYLEIRNLYVHNNYVTMTTGKSGLIQTVNNDGYYTSKGNRFQNNSYHLNGLSTPFYWNDYQRSSSQWKSYGQDVNGSFSY